MLLKPLSTNYFYAALALAVATLITLGLSEAAFAPMFDHPGVKDFLRQVVAPMFIQ